MRWLIFIFITCFYYFHNFAMDYQEQLKEVLLQTDQLIKHAENTIDNLVKRMGKNIIIDDEQNKVVIDKYKVFLKNSIKKSNHCIERAHHFAFLVYHDQKATPEIQQKAFKQLCIVHYLINYPAKNMEIVFKKNISDDY